MIDFNWYIIGVVTMDESKYKTKEAKEHDCEICGIQASCEYEGKFYCYCHISKVVNDE